MNFHPGGTQLCRRGRGQLLPPDHREQVGRAQAEARAQERAQETGKHFNEIKVICEIFRNLLMLTVLNTQVTMMLKAFDAECEMIFFLFY